MAKWDPVHVSLRVMMCDIAKFYMSVHGFLLSTFWYYKLTYLLAEVWPNVYPKELASFGTVLWW